MNQMPSNYWADRGPGKSPFCTNDYCTNGWSWDIADSFPEPCPMCWTIEGPEDDSMFLSPD